MEKRVGVGVKFRHLHPGLRLGGGVNALLAVSLLPSLPLNLFSGPAGCVVEAPLEMRREPFRRWSLLSTAETRGLAGGGRLFSMFRVDF